jgi:predicted acetyltransferase
VPLDISPPSPYHEERSPGQQVRLGVLPMALTFRTAREADLERLLEVHTSAFPDPRGREARLRNFMRNTLGGFEDLWVACEGDAIVGHAFLFPLEAWFGGARVRVAGIATLGVAPEARGRGVGSAMLGHLCRTAAERGDAVAVLYAFRQGFYARAGFATASSYRRLRLHPASIPWRAQPELRVRPATGTDRPSIEACWEDAAKGRTGSLVRGERVWEHRFANERRVWLVVEGAQGVEGYVAWSLMQSEPHAHTTLVIDEMAARSEAAERALWAVVGAQRDQVSEVRADVAGDDPIDRALVDADEGRFGDAQVEHVLGEVAAGPMVTMLAVDAGLPARGWAADGSLVLEVLGSRHRLTVRDGRAVVEPSFDEPDLTLDRRALSAIAYGALGAVDAARLGMLAAREPGGEKVLALADALFRLPPYFSPDPF